VATSLHSADAVFERHFLETRCKLLEVAANLDRVDRAEGGGTADPRRHTIDEAIRILLSKAPDRAERMQLLFSREYDPHWLEGFSGADVLRKRT
jgi:hypothetical protein